MLISGNKAIVNQSLQTSNVIDAQIDTLQNMYDKIRFLEPLITLDLDALTKELDTNLEGLEYSVKTASSISDKLERINERCKKNKVKFSPQTELLEMKDIIRYTEICEHDDIIKKTNETIENLEENGYMLSGCKNYYKRPFPETGYMGIHLNFITPYGQEIELQVHSKESFQVKQEGHELYEKIRAVGTQKQDKEKMLEEIQRIHGSILKPKDYKTLKNYELDNKEEIIKERREHVNVEIMKKKDFEVHSKTYKVFLDGEELLNGFENIQSDGSVFFYRNNWDDIHFVASLTKNGITTGEHNAEQTELSIEKTFEIAKKTETTHQEWMEEHFPNGELGKLDMEANQKNNHNLYLEEIINSMRELSHTTEYIENFGQIGYDDLSL